MKDNSNWVLLLVVARLTKQSVSFPLAHPSGLLCVLGGPAGISEAFMSRLNSTPENSLVLCHGPLMSCKVSLLPWSTDGVLVGILFNSLSWQSKPLASSFSKRAFLGGPPAFLLLTVCQQSASQLNPVAHPVPFCFWVAWFLLWKRGSQGSREPSALEICHYSFRAVHR